jgi:hypothetical protein
MQTFDHFARVATATVGALVLSTAAIGAAVGPAVPSTGQGHIAYASIEPGIQARG